jgi:DNA mismatch endonuclease, patch repair protein
MRATRQRDTKAEVALRSAIHALGLRFTVNRVVIPKSRRFVDIVFTRARVAVLVDGCFWHSCPEHHSVPKANRAWWVAKLRANWVRDRDTDLQLKLGGWLVVRIWEHEKPSTAAARVVKIVTRRIRS